MKQLKLRLAIAQMLLLCLLPIWLSTISAQTSSSESIIQQANLYLTQKKFDTAIQILEPHREELSVARLLAQTYYWNGNTVAAKKVYLNAIQQNPAHQLVQLEFGRMLFELGKGSEAKPILLKLLEVDPEQVEANMYMGYLSFQEGDMKLADSYFQKIKQRYPEHLESTQMLQAIQEKKGWQLELGTAYQWDNQPLNTLQPNLKLSRFKNNYWDPSISLNANFFDLDTSSQKSQQIGFANNIIFSKVGLQLNLKLGMYLDHVDEGANWTGAVELNQKLSKAFSLKGAWEHRPDLYALASLRQVLMVDAYSVSLNLLNGDSWMGQMAYHYTDYFDDNAIQTAYLWLLSPALKWKSSKWRLGYSGSYFHANESRYVSVYSLENLLDNYEEGIAVEGIYDPYFTPNGQTIHAALGMLELQLSKAVYLKLNANIGLAASTDLPYLYLDSLSTGLGFSREYFKEKTTTYDLNAEVQLSLSDHATITGSYQYFENFFYNFHAVRIKLNCLLVNEK